MGFVLVLALGLVSAARADTDVRRDAAVAAVEKVMPAVVNIATEEVIEQHDPYDDMLRQFFGWSGPTRRQRVLNLGSGVIINADGYLLTNNHVVRRASRIQVKLWDGRIYDAECLGANEHRDVALLRIKAKPGERFTAVRFAPDDDLLLGETVLALGNPYGLGGSVSRGILSSKTRRPPTESEALEYEDWLQTDAAINPGNSGGPLIDLRGELIGLNVATVMQAHGISFAIPIKQVNEALAGILTPEATQSLWLGLRLSPADTGLEEAQPGGPAADLPSGDQLPRGTGQVVAGPGLEVTQVQPGSPAEQAGLKSGDVLQSVNGQPVPGVFAFHRVLKDCSNHELAIVVKRGSRERSFKVRMQTFPELILQKLGLALAPLSPEQADRLGAKPGEGLVVAEVEPKGPGDQAQLQRGFLVKGLNGQPIGDIKSVAYALANEKPGDTVSLNVEVRRRIPGNFVELRQGTVELQVR